MSSGQGLGLGPCIPRPLDRCTFHRPCWVLDVWVWPLYISYYRSNVLRTLNGKGCKRGNRSLRFPLMLTPSVHFRHRLPGPNLASIKPEYSMGSQSLAVVIVAQAHQRDIEVLTFTPRARPALHGEPELPTGLPRCALTRIDYYHDK